MKIVISIFTCFLFSISSIAFAKDSKLLNDFYIGGKRFVWQGSKDLNHFYYDFNGDKKIDAFDVQVSNGVDFYTNRVNGIYLNKLSIRKSGNGLIEKKLVKDNKEWKLLYTRHLSLLDRKVASNKCAMVDKSQLISIYEKAVSCLVNPEKGGVVGHNLVQKITSGLRGDSFDVDIKNYHGKIKQFECITDTKAYNCKLDLNNIDEINDSKEIFHYFMHLAGLHHVISKVDVVYACTQCCMSDNEAACKVCSQKDTLNLEDHTFNEDLLSLFVYEDYISEDNVFPQYHNALTRVHKNLEKKKIVDTLLTNLNWNKDKIIEKLYSQFQKHLELKVNSLSTEKLFFSDMLAEIMAKIACTDFSKDLKKELNNKMNKCEIMYLARSLPSSLCFGHKNKKRCKEEYLKDYAYRKTQFKKGIRLPSNFTSLN